MAEESSGGKPGDFFVGLVDFFAILLPGGLLAFLTYTSLLRWAKLTSVAIPEGWVGFAVVGLVSYLLGHFLSVIASLCLDPAYDWWINTYNVYQDPDGWEIKAVAPEFDKVGNETRPRIPAQPAKPLNALWESLKDRAKERDNAGAPNLTEAAVTLRIASAGAAAEMDHLEADQKFFRGLILVFLFAWLTFFWDWKFSWNWKWTTVWPCLGVVLLLLPMFPFRVFKRMWPVWREEDWKRRIALGQLAAVTVLLGCWILWFTTTPRMSAWPPSVSGGSKRSENPALSVNASVGNLSVTAKSQNNENSDVLWKLRSEHSREFAAVLLFALALSVLRFVQLRLKYSKFVYRAYRILKTARQGAH